MTQENKPKIGQICAFFDDVGLSQPIIGVLREIKNFINPYMTESGDRYKKCRPLTKKEIKKFMEIANDSEN